MFLYGCYDTWFNVTSGQLDEFGIATGAEREELEYQRQVIYYLLMSCPLFLALLCLIYITALLI